MSGVVAQGGSNVAPAALVERAEHGVAEGRHDMRGQSHGACAHPAGAGRLAPHAHLAPRGGHEADPGRRPSHLLKQRTTWRAWSLSGLGRPVYEAKWARLAALATPHRHAGRGCQRVSGSHLSSPSCEMPSLIERLWSPEGVPQLNLIRCDFFRGLGERGGCLPNGHQPLASRCRGVQDAAA